MPTGARGRTTHSGTPIGSGIIAFAWAAPLAAGTTAGTGSWRATSWSIATPTDNGPVLATIHTVAALDAGCCTLILRIDGRCGETITPPPCTKDTVTNLNTVSIFDDQCDRHTARHIERGVGYSEFHTLDQNPLAPAQQQGFGGIDQFGSSQR
ncbi:MAG: hypothetical protein CMH50_15005 [Myxococcales bacterium]|nr:hypothetical protein [Myxococcales bacterium]